VEAIVGAHVHPHACGVGVTQDVGERLLHHGVHHDPGGGVHLGRGKRQVHVEARLLHTRHQGGQIGETRGRGARRLVAGDGGDLGAQRVQ